MNARTIVAIVLIVAGTLGLIYRGATYTKSHHELKVGGLQLSVAEKGELEVPVWASVGVLAVGVGLLLTGRK
jgi:hypothetical protein